MKKFSSYLMAFMAALVLSSASYAQMKPNDKIPLDPNVKYGVLENGLTYYVLANEEPKDRASFYIIQNVGAILENDEQNGLAHFLEHMAFNGTENFPDKGVLNYLESYGVTFGRNINAYTSTNETVYNLSNVPTTNEQLIDSSLLVLNDWSNYLTLAEKEIDSERGVIHEEWRTRRSGGMRIYYESRKYLYQGSKYVNRDVIGTLDVIDNFEYQQIRDFYHDWYRTDLQAIAVVGDFNAEEMETKIKNLFSKIPAIENPKERYYPEIPENEEPIVGIITDPEASSIRFNLYTKHKEASIENKDLAYYRRGILEQLYGSMIESRYQELIQTGTPPFVFGYASYYNLERKMDVYDVGAALNSDNIEGGIEALLTENERVLRYGFVASELERAKVNYAAGMEKVYKERNKQNNDALVGGIKRHYLTHEPYPGIEMDYKLAQALLPTITVEEINKLAQEWNTEKNRIITLTGPEKEGLELPNEETLLNIYDKVRKSELEAYVDEVINAPLVANIPTAGVIVAEKELTNLGAKEWTLANGAKVIIKPTTFKDDEVILTAYSKGGNSLYAANQLPSINLLGQFMPTFGIDEFDAISLEKVLAGKVVGLNSSVSGLYENFGGSSSVKDLETLLQLQYLMFTNPRFDEDAFNALKQRYMAYVSNMGADVNKMFQDSITRLKYNYNDRAQLLNTDFIESLDFEVMKKVYTERFVDASDFVFVLVGNINEDELKPMVETYLGGIPAFNRNENWKDNKVDYPDGNAQVKFTTPMESPKTSIYIEHHVDMKYTVENRLKGAIVAKLLDKKYLENIREKEGGTYGVGVFSSFKQYPNPEASLIIKFDTDPEKDEYLKGLVYDELTNVYTKDIDLTDLAEAKQNLIKVKKENLRKNGYWMNSIVHQYKHDQDYITAEEYEKLVNEITAKDIQKFAKQFLGKGENIEVMMRPE